MGGRQRRARAARRLAGLGALVLAATATGCGLAAGGGGTRDVELSVTRGFGLHSLGETRRVPAPRPESVLALLESRFAVSSTRGGNVESIAGLAAAPDGAPGPRWWYYVNGVAGTVPARVARVHGGDRVWFDRHALDRARAAPAVVGAFPEPFAHGSAGKREPVVIGCGDGVARACDVVARRLGAAGVAASRGGLDLSPGVDTLRILVAPWSQLRREPVGHLIGEGPQASGVWARVPASGAAIALLDARGRTVRQFGPGSGLIAATRYRAEEVTWVVTGPDPAGVDAAASRLDERDLRHRFAVAVSGGRAIPLPVRRGRR